MGIVIGSSFDLGSALALDSRTVRTQYSDLAAIGNAYNGLEVFTTGDNKKYRYQGNSWVEIFSGMPYFLVDPTTLSTRAGINAGYTETQGDVRRNTYLGFESGYSAIEATDNIAFGYQAGLYNTGSNNIFIGSKAGYLQGAGTANVFIGIEAGYVGGSSISNTCIGSYSGNNISGSYNTMLGNASGFTSANASYNTFIGNEAGRHNSTGWYNTYIGYSAGYTSDTVSNGVAIGAYAGCFETVEKKLFIDGLNRTDESTARTNSMIYGIFHATPTSQQLWLNAKVYMNKLAAKTSETYAVWYNNSTGELVYGTASGGSMVYPASGIANSTGSAWGISYSTTGSGTVVALATSPSITTSLVTASTTFSLINTTATTLNFAGAATTLNVGGTPTGTITHNYSTNATASTYTKTINLGTGGVSGSITNINLGSLSSSSYVTINGTLKVTSSLNILEQGSSPTYYTIIKSADLASANITYTLPAAPPAVATGYFLMSDTSGNFSWADPNDYTAYYFTTDNATPFNTSVGYTYAMSDSTYNVLIGYQSKCIGDYNVIIGANAGNASGITMDGSVLIGYGAGAWASTAIANKLIIANSNTTTPLIYGDFTSGETTLVRPTTTFTFDFTNKYTTSFSTTYLYGRREGKVNYITGSVLITTNGSSTYRLLGKINNYIGPGNTVYFTFGVRQVYEGATGYIDWNGNIYLAWGNNSSEYFHFNVVWITQ